MGSSWALRRPLCICAIVLASACGNATSGPTPSDDAAPVDDAPVDVAPQPDAVEPLDAPPPEDVAPPEDVVPPEDVAPVDTAPVARNIGAPCDPGAGDVCRTGLTCRTNVLGGVCTRACTGDADCGTTGGIQNRCVALGTTSVCTRGCSVGTADSCGREDWICDPAVNGGGCLPDCRRPGVPCGTGATCDAATGRCVARAGTRGVYEPCGGTYGACTATNTCTDIRGATQSVCLADCTSTGACPSSPSGERCVLATSAGRMLCAVPCTLGNSTPCPAGTRCVDAGAGGGAGVCAFQCTAGEACTPADAPCHTGTTTCSPGATCVDSGASVADGTSCGSGRVCRAGVCGACSAGASCVMADNPCRLGRTSCSTGASVCVANGSFAADGTACGTGSVCAGGACVACVPGMACAPTNACHRGLVQCRSTGPVCVDQGTNLANGTACGAGMVCNAGACSACAASMPCVPSAAPCNVGMISCATGAPVCTDTGVAAADGTACGAGRACAAGRCGCAAGFSTCGTTCVDLQTSTSNCGFCGVACVTGRVCVGGACRCPTGQTLCGTTCVDTATDASHCGACGNVCPAGAACMGSACVCSGGRSICSRVCTDTRVSNTNCGACGTVCPTGQVCFDNACRAPIADLPTGRSGHSAVVLRDGRIMVVGGHDGTASRTNRVDLYDPTTNTWSAGAPLPTVRFAPGVALGNDGLVYVFGGEGAPNRVEAYDPVANTWSVRSSMPTARTSASASTLPDGRIYVFGSGNCGVGFVRTIEVYIPSSDSWGTAPGLGVATSLAPAVTGADGLVYLFGGYASCYSSSTIQTFTPATGALTAVGTLTPGIYAGAATVIGSNFYVGGGVQTTFDSFGSHFSSVASFRRFNATTRAVVGLYDMPAALSYGAMVAHPNGRIYWIGGRVDGTLYPTAQVWAYSPTLDEWWR